MSYRIFSERTVLLAIVALSHVLNAEVRLPRFFSDHMILQQQTHAAIWGWADAGESIVIRASWGTMASVKAGKMAVGNYSRNSLRRDRSHLQVKGSNQIQIKDVAIGEVWLCVGQSNMGWSVANSFEAEKESEVDLPHLRIFKSAREHWHEPLAENRDRLSRWKR